MNISQSEIARPVPPFIRRDPPQAPSNNERPRSRPQREPRSFFRVFTERTKLRQERDAQRGYSVNAKQVILAFAVEFWIIALIVVGTYLLIAESDNLSREALFSALLLPAALAMVELARVPLAIAVRTQDAWHIKLFAAIGVLAAIVVTSFSLSQIAWKTFDVRIAEATRANDRLVEAKSNLDNFQGRASQLEADYRQKLKQRDDINKRLAGLEDQLSKAPPLKQRRCKNSVDAEGKPIVGPDGKIVQECNEVADASQLNALKNQIAGTKKEQEIANAEAATAEAAHKQLDRSQLEAALGKADADYRTAVNKSQLHSYAAMVTGKAVAEVREADVKNLEKYLIGIPCIAAAFASTLIAITAVRRIKRPEPEQPVLLSDEAMAHLFGPLVVAIQNEAKLAVESAMKGASKGDEASATSA